MKSIVLVVAAVAAVAFGSVTAEMPSVELNETRRLAGNTIYQMCGDDFQGYDTSSYQAPNPDTCAFLIQKNDDCTTWTNYNGGTCWLKSRFLRPTTKPSVGAVTFYHMQDIGVAYTIEARQNADMPGYDIGWRLPRRVCGGRQVLCVHVDQLQWRDVLAQEPRECVCQQAQRLGLLRHATRGTCRDVPASVRQPAELR